MHTIVYDEKTHTATSTIKNEVTVLMLKIFLNWFI